MMFSFIKIKKPLGKEEHFHSYVKRKEPSLLASGTAVYRFKIAEVFPWLTV
jgi:hypothetical protein